MTNRVLPIKKCLTDWFHNKHSFQLKFKTLQIVDDKFLLNPTLQSNVYDQLDSFGAQKIISQLPKELPFVEYACIEDTKNGLVAQVTINRDAFINDTINKLRFGLDDFPRACGLNLPKSLRQIVEFSSPNIAKPFHCGHFRSTILGNAIANIKSYLGNDVIKLNYLGDWGTQFGLLSHGYDRFGNKAELQINPIKHLYDVYVQANHLSETDPKFREEAKNKLSSMEKNLDDRELQKWTLFRQYSMKEYDKMYRNLGIEFNEFQFESNYNKLAHHWVQHMENCGLIDTLADGAKMISISESTKKRSQENEAQMDFTRVMLLKNDGSSLYISRDIAAAIERKDKYNFDEMYYIVGKDQIDHFRQLKVILMKMGHDWAKDVFHVSFGRVLGMNTRKGEVVFLQDIIDEAKLKFTESTFASKTTKSDPSDFDRLASILGLTAIYIYDLNIPKGTDYKFSWSKALNSKGNSGISLQYAHARIRSIEKHAGVDLDLNVDLNISAIEGSFWDFLIIQLSRFDDVLQETHQKHDPSILVRYLFWLSHFSNRCIAVAKVKGEAKDIAQTRLLVYHCSRKILQKGLNLIGLEALDQI